MHGRKKGVNYFDHSPQNPSAELICNFRNIDPFLTRLVPIESSEALESISPVPIQMTLKFTYQNLECHAYRENPELNQLLQDF